MSNEKNNSISGISVIVTDNSPEALEKALKKLKRKVKRSNILIDVFNSQYYDKPSDIKRAKRMKAILRNKYKVLKEKELEN